MIPLNKVLKGLLWSWATFFLSFNLYIQEQSYRIFYHHHMIIAVNTSNLLFYHPLYNHISLQSLGILVKQLNCKDREIVKSTLEMISKSYVWKYRVMACELLIALGMYKNITFV